MGLAGEIPSKYQKYSGIFINYSIWKPRKENNNTQVANSSVQQKNKTSVDCPCFRTVKDFVHVKVKIKSSILTLEATRHLGNCYKKKDDHVTQSKGQDQLLIWGQGVFVSVAESARLMSTSLKGN